MAVMIAGDQGEPEQQRRGPVGDPLRPGGGVLRLADQALNAGQGGVVADRGDLHPHAGVGGDRAGDHGVSLAATDRLRLTRDHRLVHAGRPGADRAVRGDPAAGPDHHQVTQPQVGGRDQLGVVADDPLGLVGQQRGQRVQRGGGLGQGPHLDPVAEQHDHDQQRQLPPEVELVVQDAEAGAPGGEKGHGDGQADEQHHPGLPAAELVDRAGQERPPAPYVHDGAEQRRDPANPAAVGKGVAEQHREHAGEADHRHREQQHDPEQPPELADMVSVPAVTPMPAVPRVTAVCRVVLVPAVASGLCVFGSMTLVDGSVAGLARAGLGSNVVVLAVVVGMGRWGRGTDAPLGRRDGGWGRSSGHLEEERSVGRMGVLPVAARLVG